VHEFIVAEFAFSRRGPVVPEPRVVRKINTTDNTNKMALPGTRRHNRRHDRVSPETSQDLGELG